MPSFLKNIHPLLRRSKKDYSDSNYAILHAIDDLLAEAEKETIEAKSHSYLSRAKGEFLEEWGKWFGVYRRDNETDEVYRNRIVKYLDIPRGTNQAIKLAVRRYLEDPTVGVNVYEPWKNIFYLNRSHLNGIDHLMGDYYRFAVITVSIGSPFDEDILDYLERFKSAGVQMIVVYDPTLPRVGEEGDYSAIPMLDILVNRSESLVDRITGLDQLLGGRIQLSDTDEAVNPFLVNLSDMNSNSGLTGSFTQARDYYHLASQGRAFRPNEDTTMGKVMESTIEAPQELYTASSELGTDTYQYAMVPANQLYFTLNIDNYLSRKYYGTDTNIPRTKEAYAKVLGTPEFTLALSGDTPGKTLDFQAYNFKQRAWVTLNRTLLSNYIEKENIPLGEASEYLNDNRLMFTRISVNGSVNLAIDFLSLDYRTDVAFEEAKPNSVKESQNLFPPLEEWELSGGASIDGGTLYVPEGGSAYTTYYWNGGGARPTYSFDAVEGLDYFASADYLDIEGNPITEASGRWTHNGYSSDMQPGHRKVFRGVELHEGVHSVRFGFNSNEFASGDFAVSDIMVTINSSVTYEEPTK